MKRRNFIKNTGLTIAGIALNNSIYSKNESNTKSLKVIILLSGGVRYADIIDNKKGVSILFQEGNFIDVNCKTELKYSGKSLEHSNALLNALEGVSTITTKKIFISNLNSDTTKAVVESNLPLDIITTTAIDSEKPYRNDAAVFEKAEHYLQNEQNLTLILNLEDTDIAHCNADKYQEVLNYYSLQIDALCKKIYSPEFRRNAKATLTVASVLGRNNFDNERSTLQGGSDHYDESARELFFFETSFSQNYNLKFDHTLYESNQLFTISEKNFV